ncbi:putative N-succinyldiaminopimelate aminotransferase DapC [Corynebacterium lowii]|uniref:Putative N-succinyldiaminopimelate aminotransferase DapC n=2 Tax=Corynebacterium lowii TaxID=1544413 RepID=A0A0N8W093_9CORY|nr:putative N-succinyldiaminopimelate aminotransferase DapC [Corynebacterium lowii]
MAKRLDTVGDSIFAELSARALKTGAINLGQGFPDDDGPKGMLEIAQEEIVRGHNQYAPLTGIPELRKAIAEERAERLGQSWNPDTEVCVTSGATEGIAASILATVNPGDEVIVFDPFYDSYAAVIAFAGAIRRPVPLQREGNTWGLDLDELKATITNRTRAIILNNPHNPTGSLFPKEQLEELSEVANQYDLLVISDEVYERLLAPGEVFIPTASIKGLRERTITVSSAAKTFNVTGWKTGWVLAEAPLLKQVMQTKQFLTFVSTTPFQAAVAYALREESKWVEQWNTTLHERREQLRRSLEEMGWEITLTKGSYFLVAREPHKGALPESVVALPVGALSDDPQRWEGYYRFAFCKGEEATAEAARRLRG